MGFLLLLVREPTLIQGEGLGPGSYTGLEIVARRMPCLVACVSTACAVSPEHFPQNKCPQLVSAGRGAHWSQVGQLELLWFLGEM